MAIYNERYFWNWTDLVGKEYGFIIDEDGFGGVPVLLVGMPSDPIKQSKNSDGIFHKTVATEVTLKLISDTNFKFEDFFEADWDKFRLRLFEAGTCIGTYYYVPDIFNEQHMFPPYEVEMKFACGINKLGVIDFDNAGTLFEGKQSLIEITRRCFNLLPTPLDVREVMNVYEDSMALSGVADSPLNQLFTNTEAYRRERKDGGETSQEALECREVLEMIYGPFGTQIFQEDNKWHLIRTKERQAKTLDYRDFNARLGDEDTITVDGNDTLSIAKDVTKPNHPDRVSWMGPPEQPSVRKTERFKITYTTQHILFENNDLLTDGQLQSLTDNGTFFQSLYWNNGTSIDPTDYETVFRDPIVLSAYLPDSNCLVFDADEIEGLSAIDLNVWFGQTKDNVALAATDSFEIAFMQRFDIDYIHPLSVPGLTSATWTAVQNFITYTMEAFYEIEMILDDGLTPQYLTGDIDLGYSWTTVPSRAVVKIFYNEMNMSGFNQEFRLKTIAVPVNPYGIAEVVDFSFKIYGPYSNIPDFLLTEPDYAAANGMVVDRAMVGELHCTVVDGGAIPPVEVITVEELDPDSIELEMEFSHGDGPSSISQNSYFLADNTPTDAWARRGRTEALKLHNIHLRERVDMQGEVQTSFRGTLAPKSRLKFIERLGIKVTTPTGVRFFNCIATEWEWDMLKNEYTGTWQEITDSGRAISIVEHDSDNQVPDRDGQDEPLLTLDPEPIGTPRSMTSGPSVTGSSHEATTWPT